MTRKDYILIANAVNDMRYTLPNKRDRIVIARELADALRTTNPRFDRDRFIDACTKDE